jgi:hypothetical protein
MAFNRTVTGKGDRKSGKRLAAIFSADKRFDAVS